MNAVTLYNTTILLQTALSRVTVSKTFDSIKNNALKRPDFINFMNLKSL
jgi:hypothetical protein